MKLIFQYKTDDDEKKVVWQLITYSNQFKQ